MPGFSAIGETPIGGMPSGAAAYAEASISESLGLAQTIVGQRWMSVYETLVINQTLVPVAHIGVTISETLRLGGQVGVILQAALSDHITLTAALSNDRSTLVALVDSLVLTGAATNTIRALAAISDALALASTLRSLQDGTIADAAAFSQTLAAQVAWFEAMTSAIVLTSTLTPSAAVTVLLDDSLAFADEADARGSFIAALIEELDFAVSFNLGDDSYVGYAMNPATHGLTSYTNFEFNSLATFGSKTYAAGAAGLYELGGTTDAGDPIGWRIRTGLTNLGTQHLKGLDAAYLGYTATGRILLKCIVVGTSGEKIGYWYELTPQTANAPRAGRIPTGRGLRSVYWGFEMTNLDPVTEVASGGIELDSLELHPIMLEGRLY